MTITADFPKTYVVYSRKQLSLFNMQVHGPKLVLLSHEHMSRLSVAQCLDYTLLDMHVGSCG